MLTQESGPGEAPESPRRLEQMEWLRGMLREAERALEALGLPADCWHAMWITGWDQDEPDPYEDHRLMLRSVLKNGSDGQIFEVKEYLREYIEACDERTDNSTFATYNAALARACDLALSTRNPEHCLVLGRLIAAYEANILFPGRVRDVRSVQVSRGVSAQRADPRRPEPHIIAVVQQLIADGTAASERDACRIVAEDPRYAETRLRLNGVDGYTESGIRGIWRNRAKWIQS